MTEELSEKPAVCRVSKIVAKIRQDLRNKYKQHLEDLNILLVENILHMN